MMFPSCEAIKHMNVSLIIIYSQIQDGLLYSIGQLEKGKYFYDSYIFLKKVTSILQDQILNTEPMVTSSFVKDIVGLLGPNMKLVTTNNQ